MTTFPRGLAPSQQQTPIATARWAYPLEVAEYAYRPGDIWLGVQDVPHVDALPTLEELLALQTTITQHTGLNETWRAEVSARISAHIDTLSATDEVEIGSRDDRHLATMGGTRGGKGTAAIIPNLCLYPYSLICIDPKGENARTTASRRGMGSKNCDGLGQTVAVLDPYDTTKLPADYKASWNPLDMLDVDDPMMVDRATSIVEALIIRANPEYAHFDDAARSLIKGILLYVCVAYAGRPDRNLITVYDLLTRGAIEQLKADQEEHGPSADDPDAFTYLLFLMKRREEFGGIISAAATMVLAMGGREKGSVLSTARLNMEFIERPAMRAVLQTSSFDMDQLKTDPNGMTLYLCLPPQRMSDCGRWLRLIINICLNRMYEIDDQPACGGPVLFLLEEFASLAHMEIIEHAAGYAAGFGVKLWIIIQDVPQLKRHYKEGWETFLGNAGVIQAFANSDETTLGFLSKKIGETEITQLVSNLSTNLSASTNDPGTYQRLQGFMQVRSPVGLMSAPLGLMVDPQSTSQSASTSMAHNEHIQRVPLLLPDEIERFFKRETMCQLVAIKGEVPMALGRRNYFDAPQFAGLFDPIRAPFHTKTEAMAAAEQTRATRAVQRKGTIDEAERFVAEVKQALRKVPAKGR